MTTYRRNSGDGLRALFRDLTHGRRFTRGAAWGMIILVALLAFEVSNFNATRFALRDILGNLSFGGLQWATILAIAFCGIDFAGIARIFTPEQGRDEPTEVYYLFGAWVLAAGFNATLTWWGVAVAINNNPNLQGSAVMSAETLTKAVPIFIAAMVWLIRLLIIGTFSLAGDRLFSTASTSQRQTQASYNNPQPRQSGYQPQHRPVNQPVNQPVLRPASQINRPVNSGNSVGFKPAPKPAVSQQSSFIPPEPTYHPVSYNSRASESTSHYDA